ncbi:MAG: SMP-30/gluconolactonase/LRE family protein [Abditibacteriales bacterium]|nr:SMP-30/gluconolactonase/LRE family protein [Abditibacteriales bacterium]
MEPQLVADYACHTGENPLWHPMEKKVYWTDIPQGRIFRYDPATGEHEPCYEGEVVGGFTVQADGALLLFMAKGAVATWRDGQLDYIIEELPDERDNRFNDVIADPVGRVFCGVMSTKDRPGRLYRLDTDGTLTVLLEGIGVSNGLGFTPDRRQLYYTDSSARKIYLFDYESETGAIYNQRTFVEVPDAEGEGWPDGLTVDAEGYVWSARWDGGCIVRYAPDGTEERRIKFPAKKVASLTFGGKDYTDLYVICAGGQNKDTDGAGAGALFRLNLGIRGVPEFFSRVGLGSA